MGILSELEPNSVFKYFEDICNIPHGSGNTDGITQYLVEFAKNKNLEYIVEPCGNCIIKKPASKGCEECEPVLLQGHVDMVCEKNFDYDSKHDFMSDPLKLAVMDDYVFAKGTTLGADDGIAVAYMLAILEDDTIKIPRLECLFTVDEEIGMRGMLALDESNITARRMINIDNEMEGEILTSSAGGRMVKCQIPVRYTEKTGYAYDIVICGLRGGHSGQEIDKYRGNANLLMGRLLHYISSRLNYDVYYLKGGLQDNAIPREAKVSVIIHEKDASKLEDYVADFQTTIQNEYRHIEDNITIYCESRDKVTERVLTPKTKDRIVFLLMTVPDGIVKMCPDLDKVVQTSSNAGIARLKDTYFELIINIRSSISSEKQALSDKIQFLTETIGGKFLIESDFPAWEYRQKSKLRDLVCEVFNNVYGYKPQFNCIHACLECGVVIDKINDMDIVALGPNIEDIHTPKEKLDIKSCERTYELLIDILEKCTEE